jgi:hypothetical protein
MTRALYISPLDMTVNNGMLQRQAQTLAALVTMYPGCLDILSLAAAPKTMRKWLLHNGVQARVLDGPRAWAAYACTTAWYVGGVAFCNKLKWAGHFGFPFRIPLSQAWLDRYATIICYYPWAYHLLKLERGGRKVVVDLGDIMADRHSRIGTRRWISLAADDERAILRSTSRSLAISESDAEEFEHLYGRRLPVVPFCPANADRLVALSRVERPRRVGFIGAPSYLNEGIVELLASPAFLEPLRTAGIELVVAGGICNTVDPRHLTALRDGGAKVLGTIPDVESFYRAVEAVLNPVGPSTGIKIKSVETLLTGCSLITTRWGTDASLQRSFGGQIRLLDWPATPAGVARATIDLLAAATRPLPGAAAQYVTQVRNSMCEALSP